MFGKTTMRILNCVETCSKKCKPHSTWNEYEHKFASWCYHLYIATLLTRNFRYLYILFQRYKILLCSRNGMITIEKMPIRIRRKIPEIIKQIEAYIYLSAPSKKDYVDRSTLKTRLMLFFRDMKRIHSIYQVDRKTRVVATE